MTSGELQQECDDKTPQHDHPQPTSMTEKELEVARLFYGGGSSRLDEQRHDQRGRADHTVELIDATTRKKKSSVHSKAKHKKKRKHAKHSRQEHSSAADAEVQPKQEPTAIHHASIDTSPVESEPPSPEPPMSDARKTLIDMLSRIPEVKDQQHGNNDVETSSKATLDQHHEDMETALKRKRRLRKTLQSDAALLQQFLDSMPPCEEEEQESERTPTTTTSAAAASTVDVLDKLAETPEFHPFLEQQDEEFFNFASFSSSGAPIVLLSEEPVSYYQQQQQQQQKVNKDDLPVKSEHEEVFPGAASDRQVEAYRAPTSSFRRSQSTSKRMYEESKTKQSYSQPEDVNNHHQDRDLEAAVTIDAVSATRKSRSNHGLYKTVPVESANTVDKALSSVDEQHKLSTGTRLWSWWDDNRKLILICVVIFLAALVGLVVGLVMTLTKPASGGEASTSSAPTIAPTAREIQVWSQLGTELQGETEFDQFGASVSISGNTLVVGAHQSFRNEPGYVKIYQYVDGDWSLGGKLVGERHGDRFGASVSLAAGDSNALAIGAPQTFQDGFGGYAHIYKYIDGDWTLVATPLRGVDQGDELGHAVSLSRDGTRLGIGAPQTYQLDNLGGYVRVYQDTGGDSWTDIGERLVGEAPGDGFGWSLSLSTDGSVLSVGAIANDESAEKAGHVRAYQNYGDDWTSLEGDIDGATAFDLAGYAVSLSGDGNVMAVGAIGNDGIGRSKGYVRVFRNLKGQRTQVAGDIELSTGEIESIQVRSLSLSDDGSLLAIGAIHIDRDEEARGRVHFYRIHEMSWSRIDAELDNGEPWKTSGIAVSLSSDGSTVAVAVPGKAGFDFGRVMVYRLENEA